MKHMAYFCAFLSSENSFVFVYGIARSLEPPPISIFEDNDGDLQNAKISCHRLRELDVAKYNKGTGTNSFLASSESLTIEFSL